MGEGEGGEGVWLWRVGRRRWGGRVCLDDTGGRGARLLRVGHEHVFVQPAGAEQRIVDGLRLRGASEHLSCVVGFLFLQPST